MHTGKKITLGDFFPVDEMLVAAAWKCKSSSAFCPCPMIYMNVSVLPYIRFAYYDIHSHEVDIDTMKVMFDGIR